jgi:hypothetical protein
VRHRWLVPVVLALPTLLAAQTAPASRQVRIGATVSRDTVTVGEPFEIRVRVRVSPDARIVFPDLPDTTGMVQARDPRTVVTHDSVQSLDQTAVYRVAAWDTETQHARFSEIVVSWESPSAQRSVAIPPTPVFVRTVLPADSALRVPKPARPLWEVRAFPWWILAAILAAIAIGVLIWWWWKRRQRPKPVVVVDPYDRARREFNRIEAMGLIDAGERTRFVALVVEVVRDYIAARYPDARLSLTSRELVAMVRRHPAITTDQLSRVLHEADLAKFAGWSLSEERARALSRDARAVVDHDHAAALAATPTQTQAAA